MAANTYPVYSKVGKFGSGGTSGTFPVHASAAQSPASPFDGTGTIGTNIFVAFVSDSTNGSFLRSLVAKIMSTGVGVASVLRFWINNGSANTTNTNNALYKEISIPALTATQLAAFPDFEIACNILLPPDYRILYAFGTAPVNLWSVFGIGGDL